MRASLIRPVDTPARAHFWHSDSDSGSGGASGQPAPATTTSKFNPRAT